MRFYKSMIFGVSMLAVASANAVGKGEFEGSVVGTDYEKKVKFKDTSDTNLLSPQQSVEKINQKPEVVKKVILEEIKIDMERDLEPQFKDHQLSKLVVKISKFNAEKLEGLLKYENILKLDLSYNYLGNDVASKLAQHLETNTTLEILDLSYNDIDDVGLKNLSQTLKTNKSLSELNLWGNKIRDVGVKDLAQTLQTNDSLKTLDLSYNSIGDEGAKALLESLEKNKTLKFLYLTSNCISQKLNLQLKSWAK